MAAEARPKECAKRIREASLRRLQKTWTVMLFLQAAQAAFAASHADALSRGSTRQDHHSTRRSDQTTTSSRSE